jgi:predicted transcriptional regulator
VADPQGPPDETLLKAYELQLAGRTQRQIAAELGVSRSTAHGYIQRGRAVYRLHATTERQEHHDDSAQRLHGWVGRLEALWDQVDSIADACALMRELRALEQSRRALLGLDAAAKLQIDNRATSDAAAFERDATLIAVRSLLAQRNEHDEAELRAGRSGVIDGPGGTA